VSNAGERDAAAVDPAAFIERYRARMAGDWSADTAVDRVRFVVLDSETTGLDPRTDRLVTIGAVAVLGGEIRLDDTFEALIALDRNTSAVTVHGITRDESRQGVSESDALARFLDYLGTGVIVGHHILHDIQTLDAGYERHWGFTLGNHSLDTMDLTRHLEQDGALGAQAPIRHFTLDSLCEMFGVVPHDRHTASGDAFITAQVFLRLLRLSWTHGRRTLASVAAEFVERDPAA
jgi:DNA polymerase-3 subunit epsilon